jgi:hypothetical protein
MGGVSESLETKMHECIPDGGFAVLGGRDLFMEVMDTTSRRIWMSGAAVQLSDWEALELEAPLVKSGIGRAAMDRAAFLHSPGATDEPVRERVIGGHLFINVATPAAPIPPSQPEGPMEAFVDKAHVLGFDAGRSISILTLPEGDFVEVIGDSSEDASRVLPAGGILKKIELAEPWIVSLPTPTRAFFWWGKSARSFQGPVTLPTQSRS